MNPICPVCGYELDFAPWVGESSADEICPSCGIQFGYDDAASGDPQARSNVYDEWRESWIKNGMRWFSSGVAQPPNWNPNDQLLRLK
jgi:hypothetical protein